MALLLTLLSAGIPRARRSRVTLACSFWLFKGLALLFCLTLLTAQAAQPDYTNAIWRSAYPGHWYTSGNAHAFVVEHDMEGYYWTTLSFFQQSGTQASIHYCVNGLQNGSESVTHSEHNTNDPPAGEISQMVEEKNWAWHVRCW